MRFFEAYTRAFSTRPAFRPPDPEKWIADYAGDPEFRPHLSLLAFPEDDRRRVTGAVVQNLPYQVALVLVIGHDGRTFGADVGIAAGCNRANAGPGASQS